MTSGDDSEKSRQGTDAKLRVERERADENLFDESSALELVKLARERAKLILELARRREDDQPGLDPEDLGRIAGERRNADARLLTEYADADAAIFSERSKRRRAALQLLALERQHTDRTLSSERSIADRRVAARDDLLGVVSHDLRGHLSAVLLRASLVMVTHETDEQLVKNAQVMQHVIAVMDKMLSDLLDVASMEMGAMRLERVPTDLAAVVTEEIDIHRPAATSRSIEMALDVESPITVEIDPIRISRVIMNVLANALKFTPEGGRVEVRVRKDDREAGVSVKDSGPGIPADQLEAVFERYRRIDTETRGYGLGLYIARAIVTAHTGRIWAESKVGEGSTFHIRLPAS